MSISCRDLVLAHMDDVAVHFVAMRQPAMSSISVRQRSATVAARPASRGRAHPASSARRRRERAPLVLQLFDAARMRILSAALLLDGRGRVAGQGGSFGGQSGGQRAAQPRSRDLENPRDGGAHPDHGATSVRARTEATCRRCWPASICVGAALDGLLDRGHFRGIDHRRLGDGFFDLLQRAGGVVRVT